MQLHASTSVHVYAQISNADSHTIVPKILDTLVGMGSTALAAAVPHHSLERNPNFPPRIISNKKSVKKRLHLTALMAAESMHGHYVNGNRIKSSLLSAMKVAELGSVSAVG